MILGIFRHYRYRYIILFHTNLLAGFQQPKLYITMINTDHSNYTLIMMQSYLSYYCHSHILNEITILYSDKLQLSDNEDKKDKIWNLRCNRSLKKAFAIHLLDVTTDMGTYSA